MISSKKKPRKLKNEWSKCLARHPSPKALPRLLPHRQDHPDKLRFSHTSLALLSQFVNDPATRRPLPQSLLPLLQVDLHEEGLERWVRFLVERRDLELELIRDS